MKTIGLDLDGVLYDWHGVIFDYIKYHKQIPEDYKDFWRKARLDNYCRELLTYLVDIPIFYTKKDIMPRTLRVVEELAKNNRIYYITTRPDSAKHATMSWLKRCNLPHYENLIITQNKRPYIAMLECDYFVDDRFKTIDNIQDITNAILFKSNYMYDEDVEGYNYIEQLEELLEVRL